MFAESIDDNLQEFIYAANQCIEEDGRFVRDRRYDKIMNKLLAMPADELQAYAGKLEIIASRTTSTRNSQKWEEIVYRFRRDLEVLGHS
jgi:hypothetical protein